MQIEGRGPGIANVSLAPCIPLPVPVVAMRHRFLSSRMMTGPFIVAIVIAHKVLADPTTSTRAGNRHESHSHQSGGLL